MLFPMISTDGAPGISGVKLRFVSKLKSIALTYGV